MKDDTTPNEAMVSLPHDACDSTIVVAPGPMLDPTPIVLQRQASDLAFCAPETLAAKLRAVGYREPILPRTCAVDGCANFTHALICQDCEIEIESLAQMEEDRKYRRKSALAFWPALLLVLALLAALFYGAAQLGAFVRWLLP